MSNPTLAYGAPEERSSKINGFKRRSVRPGQKSILKVKGVEGWRGLACLLVVVFHVWQTMDRNDTGVGPYAKNANVFDFYYNIDIVVDLFFVLSGLLLFLPFANAAIYDDVPVPARRTFIYRRLLRLLPVYWAVVLFSWFPRNFGFGTAQWLDLLEHLTLTQAFDSERIFYTVGPAWTLSVEFMFYLTLFAIGPPFVRYARRARTDTGRFWRLALPTLGVAAASYFYKLNVEFVWDIPVTDWAWRFGPAAKADVIAFGMLLAIIVASLKGIEFPSFMSPVLILGGILLISQALYHFNEPPTQIFLASRHTVSALGWCLILMGVMLVKSNIPAKIVDNKLAVKLSVLAYTVYLVHEPLLLGYVKTPWWTTEPTMLIPNTIIVMTLTLLGAWFIHRTIEEPWVDLAALQKKNGGRKELYEESFETPAIHTPLKVNPLKVKILETRMEHTQ